jgi:UDPglucose 6-dehydrogenase
MKEGSDNFRESAVLDIMTNLKKKKIKIILYEPYIKESLFDGIEVIPNLSSFILRSDLIIANRLSKELNHVLNKVYSRDIFQEN